MGATFNIEIIMNSLSAKPYIQPVDDWRWLLNHCITEPTELLELLELPSNLLYNANIAAADFALKVPITYLNKIKKSDINDPLLRQILPIAEELYSPPEFTTDPLEESAANQQQGIIHKYHGRVLVIVSSTCAINCRYCFRRHFPYSQNRLGYEQWQQVISYIKADKNIQEVIFSGGDPLAISDKKLGTMIADLEQIPHLQRLRIHSRLPAVIPQRITVELCQILTASRLLCVMVLHINHSQEIDNSTQQAVQKLRQAGVSILNQAVLLRSVNNSSEQLKQLSESLFAAGILPYYLFTLDPVKGASHFDIPDNLAIQLITELQKVLPGYLVPKLAKEIPDKASKTLLLNSDEL